MTFPRETIFTGADPHCPDCGRLLSPQRMYSAAGWYIGTACCCGPYTRETKYYPSEDTLLQMVDSQTLQYRIPSGFTKPIPLQPILSQ